VQVKELVPEFYYLPNFLVNECAHTFGETQSRGSIDSVALPPWAKGDAHKFIRIHRQVLSLLALLGLSLLALLALL
jgi:hypothetical protein